MNDLSGIKKRNRGEKERGKGKKKDDIPLGLSRVTRKTLARRNNNKAKISDRTKEQPRRGGETGGRVLEA